MVVFDCDGNHILVRFHYNACIVQDVKEVIPRGFFRKEAGDSYWIFPWEALESLHNSLNKYKIFLSEKLTLKLNAETEQAEKQHQITQEREQFCQDFLAKDATNWKFQPYKHQMDGVNFILAQSNLRAIISDQMGLGKTKTALMAVKALQAYFGNGGDDCVIRVLAPVSLRLNWLLEAASLQVAIEVYSHAKIPSPLDAKKYLLIADEAHAFQNIKALRTKAFLDLAWHENCAATILLTGTPMKNGRPSNLYPLLKAVKHPIADDRKKYERRYCDAHPSSFTQWDITGASNLEELNEKISDKLIIRTKEECLDLPEKIYQSIQCEKLEGDRQYEESLQSLKEKYAQKVKAGEVSYAAQALVFLSYLRRLNSLYKAEKTIELAQELIDENQSVVIFTEFIDSAQSIADKFSVPMLYGQTPVESRQQIVEDFQAGVNPVFVGTIRAGGVGITLTKASYLIMNDFPWTPGDYNQACDRIHRIGQRSTCHIYDIYAKDIDYIMAGILEKKSEAIDKVLKKHKIKLEKKTQSDFYIDILHKLIK